MDVKGLHNYECQICGDTIMLPEGLRYAEAHHIQPLGAGHKGPDIRENILCVCPNHHAELDLGAGRIQLQELRHANKHQVAERYIDYHNKNLYRRV
jgi:predicted restriction endonuclease